MFYTITIKGEIQEVSKFDLIPKYGWDINYLPNGNVLGRNGEVLYPSRKKCEAALKDIKIRRGAWGFEYL